MSLWQDLSLQKKIVLIIIATTLSATISIVPALFFTIRTAMMNQQQAYLTGVRNLVEGLLEDNHRAVMNYAVLFSRDRAVKDNLFYHTELAGERIHPLRAVKHLVDAFDVEFIELTDREGSVVANTSEPDLFDVSRKEDPYIRDALSGKTTTGIKRLTRGMLLTASSPIYYDQGQLIGTITTGIFMDDLFVKRIRNLSGAEIGITDSEGTLLASSLPALKTSAPQPAQGREVLHISGKRYILMRMPIKGNDTRPSGELLIMTEDKLPEIIKNAHITVTFILVFIAVLSIVATGLIIRRVLKPVQALEMGAERIGKGDFRQRIDMKSGDEIGKLADAFNKMAENLEKMREMEERLSHAERLASIGRFTAGIAHEMNNPIANIIGLLKITRREITDESIREDLDIAIKEAMRCGAIVRDLLLYSRQSPPHKEPLHINSLVEEVVKTIEQSQDLTGIEIIFSPGNDLPAIYADPVQIEQVMRNLILNAIQAIEDKGRITIETSKEGMNLLIKVTDTGKGMDAEEVEKIFYPFYTTKGTGEGTGLGLTVSYGIVQAHGGEIKVKSKKGEGSCFTVKIPISPDLEGRL